MRCSIRKGFSFGVTSGIITTLGLIIGLHSSTGSVMVVIGGIIVIAIADAMSDALGIHISEEAENKHSIKEIWEATIMTFVSKFIFAIMFIIPFLFFSLNMAIYISVGWGLLLLVLFSYFMAKRQKTGKVKVIFEHLLIAIVVIIVTHYIGNWVANFS